MSDPFSMVNLTDEQKEVRREIDRDFTKLWKKYKFDLAESRMKSLAITHLEIAHSFIVKHIERHEETEGKHGETKSN